MEKNQMFLVTTEDSAAILPTVDRAGDYVLGLLQEIIDKGTAADLRIRSRPAMECKMFLDGTVPAIQPAQKEPQQRKEAPAKKQKKAAGGGGQNVPAKAAAPVKVKKEKGLSTVVKKTNHDKALPQKEQSKTDMVFQCVNSCDSSKALTAQEICTKTGLKGSSVFPLLTALYKSNKISKKDEHPLRFYRLCLAESQQPGPNQIMCKAKGRVVPIDQCKPNDASPVCRSCPNIEH